MRQLCETGSQRGKTMEETKQIIENSQPIQIEISTNAKGQHQWTIKLSGADIDNLTSEAMRIDDKLSEKFKGERE